MPPDYVTDELIDGLIEQALKEDLGEAGDITSLATIPEGKSGQATISTKEDGVVAGLQAAEGVFQRLDSTVTIEWFVADGAHVGSGTDIGSVAGSSRSILSGERLALNIMQRMSGIATATRSMVELVKPYGTRILDTRKTAPGLRMLDKWAVRLGGGHNHRLGLYDMILIKDNHIAACGGVAGAVEAANAYRQTNSADVLIEVEVRTLEELRTLLSCEPVDWVLLDNMAHSRSDGSVDISLLEEAVETVGGKMATEASGNVTVATAAPIASTGVDAISCGSLTHSVRALDISMGMEVTRNLRAW